MRRRNRLIMGSALGLAAIAVAIDHTRHRLPAPVSAVDRVGAGEAAPCALDENPCSLDDNPCSLDVSPCNL